MKKPMLRTFQRLRREFNVKIYSSPIISDSFVSVDHKMCVFGVVWGIKGLVESRFCMEKLFP